jgi:LacI family transcriptional regulator
MAAEPPTPPTSGASAGQPATPRARLSDVSRAAGVSKSIASRVLNGVAIPVLPETRARVLASAKALNYRPHAGARALKSVTTGALGLSVPDLTNPVFAHIVRGAWNRALARDFAVLVVEDLVPEEADQVFTELLRAGRIDGLIMASASPGHPILDGLAASGLPHVFLNRAVEASGRNVIMEDGKASELAVEHLNALGHRRIGHIAGPAGLWNARERAEAFRERALQWNLPEPPIVQAEFSEAGGARAADRLFSEHSDVTAVYVSMLTQAIGVMHAAWARGMAIPGDLSVVTSDDQAVAGFLRPSLTRIRMPLAELGAAGVDALIEQIFGGAPSDVVIPSTPVLIPGGSTAAATAAAS